METDDRTGAAVDVELLFGHPGITYFVMPGYKRAKVGVLRDDVLTAAKTLGLNASDAAVEAAVIAAGGERFPFTNLELWPFLVRQWKRLRGKPSPPTSDIYIVPRDLVPAAR